MIRFIEAHAAAAANASIVAGLASLIGSIEPVALGLVALHAGAEYASHQRTEFQVERDALASYLVSALALLAVYVLVVAGPAISLMTAGIWVLGIALRVCAMVDLGSAFCSSAQPSVAPSVRSGLYRWMRHPSEWGLALCLWAAALASGGPAIVVAMAGSIASIWRVRLENSYSIELAYQAKNSR